ncbi:hypothetical protein [Chromobacterium violaceum]|uniref:Uncharacterized protein n=1 Tax=Chromobacterium violaceum TaxID=536 RepID=A0A202B2H3_CHRVL|nr:hypothetical protein [Chromobacterium violaceum]OVE45667.1 hypothetical protein CBW21_21995 [Chromobacterium violaceum]
MAFTDAEKTDIRRFCGFPVFGGQPVQAFGHRFFTQYGTLEFRLNNLQPGEEAVIRNTYLANLLELETDIVETRDNLDTAQAAVWTRNRNEVRDREALFDGWRRRLCGFLGVAPGPALGDGGMSLVV